MPLEFKLIRDCPDGETMRNRKQKKKAVPYTEVSTSLILKTSANAGRIRFQVGSFNA